MTKLEKYLYQLRRIEEHREKAAEQEIRKIYKEVLREVNGYIGNIYATYSEDDMLDYSMLAKAGMDARFLEEVEGRINGISPKVASMINDTVEQTYEACYDGMRNAVTKAAGNRELLQQAFSTVTAVTPDVIRQAVNNPIAGLTLKDTLEKHRKDIIYDIKKNIGVGLSNGDRYSTMAKRIAESIDGDYTKAVRIVRTETHRVRESGYNDAATDINEALKNGSSGYVMAKTWRTMDDERVRPAKAKGKARQYNHVKMDGVTIPQDAMFELPSGAKCKCPSQTGVAGEDINCRCYLSYDLVLASELTKVQDGKKTIDEAVETSDTIQTIDECKTVKEVEQLFKEQDWFVHSKINGREWRSDEHLSLDGCDLQSSKTIYSAFDKFYKKYPQMKGKLSAPNCAKLPNGSVMAQSSMGFGEEGITVNKMWFRNFEFLERELTKSVNRGYMTGTGDPIAVILHELGHSLDGYLTVKHHVMDSKGKGKTGWLSNKMRPKVLKSCGLNIEDIEKEVSIYATTNANEWFAECFAEYMTSNNPRKVALEVGKLLDEIMKGVK